MTKTIQDLEPLQCREGILLNSRGKPVGRSVHIGSVPLTEKKEVPECGANAYLRLGSSQIDLYVIPEEKCLNLQCLRH